MSEQQAEAIKAARAMTATLEALRGELAAANERSRNAEKTARGAKTLARGLAVSLVLDLALTGWLTFSNIRISNVESSAQHNTATVSQLHAAQESGCQQANSRMASSEALWGYLFSKSVIPKSYTKHQRAVHEAEYARLHELVNSAYGPRNCETLYHLGR